MKPVSSNEGYLQEVFTIFFIIIPEIQFPIFHALSLVLFLAVYQFVKMSACPLVPHSSLSLAPYICNSSNGLTFMNF